MDDNSYKNSEIEKRVNIASIVGGVFGVGSIILSHYRIGGCLLAADIIANFVYRINNIDRKYLETHDPCSNQEVSDYMDRESESCIEKRLNTTVDFNEEE